MERLLEIARKKADAVTVYGISETRDTVGFENARLKNADSGMSSGTALTVVKDGKQGFAYTRNLIDREGLVRDAVAALAGASSRPGTCPSRSSCHNSTPRRSRSAATHGWPMSAGE